MPICFLCNGTGRQLHGIRKDPQPDDSLVNSSCVMCGGKGYILQKGTKMPYNHAVFMTAFNQVADEVHKTARSKGFWEDRDDLMRIAPISDGVTHNDGRTKAMQQALDSQMIALMHTELAEVTEAMRHGDPPDDKIPEFSGAEAELADCIIRIMDFAQGRRLRVAEAIVAKMEYNSTRPYKHGKTF